MVRGGVGIRRAAEVLEEGGEVKPITFTVPGQPVAKARARVCVNRGKVHSFTPAKTTAYESTVRLAFTLAYPNHVPLEGALWVEATAYFMPPKSFTLPKPHEDVDIEDIPHTKRPDADNIAKIFSDALNGVAWRDDSQIASLSIDKRYSMTPRLEVSISQIGTEGK
jgi:Holliday junction resolvase RusA-like endonuclease